MTALPSFCFSQERSSRVQNRIHGVVEKSEALPGCIDRKM